MSTNKQIYVVMTSSQDHYAVVSCIGVFDDRSKAEAYALTIMEEGIRDEGRGLEIDEIEHDSGQYVLVLSHEGTDFIVMIDYCPDRTGN